MGLIATLTELVPQKLLFSDFSSTPEEHTEKELSRYSNHKGECSDGIHCTTSVEESTSKNEPGSGQKGSNMKVMAAILVEQIANAFIVGGVAFFSTLAASQGQSVSLKAAGIAFGMTFFFELRKYRKL